MMRQWWLKLQRRCNPISEGLDPAKNTPRSQSLIVILVLIPFPQPFHPQSSSTDAALDLERPPLQMGFSLASLDCVEKQASLIVTALDDLANSFKPPNPRASRKRRPQQRFLALIWNVEASTRTRVEVSVLLWQAITAGTNPMRRPGPYQSSLYLGYAVSALVAVISAESASSHTTSRTRVSKALELTEVGWIARVFGPEARGLTGASVEHLPPRNHLDLAVGDWHTMSTFAAGNMKLGENSGAIPYTVWFCKSYRRWDCGICVP